MDLFMDKALARRLERTEGAINASFIEARLALRAGSPGDSGAGLAWRDFDGTYAAFDGLESPMTQTFGLGLWTDVSAEGLAAIEAFYRGFGSATVHEVSPFAGASAYALLHERGYVPVELTTVLARPLDEAISAAPSTTDLTVRAAGPDEADKWVRTSNAGWGHTAEEAERFGSIAQVAFQSPRLVSFLVERGGEAIATGSLGVHEGVALLGGASTIPEARGRGAQNALFTARLAEARSRGCDVALMCAEPGTTSQKNAERNGFRVAYTRVKWKLGVSR